MLRRRSDALIALGAVARHETAAGICPAAAGVGTGAHGPLHDDASRDAGAVSLRSGCPHAIGETVQAMSNRPVQPSSTVYRHHPLVPGSLFCQGSRTMSSRTCCLVLVLPPRR